MGMILNALNEKNSMEWVTINEVYYKNFALPKQMNTRRKMLRIKEVLKLLILASKE